MERGYWRAGAETKNETARTNHHLRSWFKSSCQIDSSRNHAVHGYDVGLPIDHTREVVTESRSIMIFINPSNIMSIAG